METPVWSVARLRACRTARRQPALPEALEGEVVAILESVAVAVKELTLQSLDTQPAPGYEPIVGREEE